MIKQLSWLPFLLIGSAFAFGCSDTPEEDSCNIKTAGLYAEYAAIAQGSGALGRAELWVGNAPGGTILTLGGSCGDSLTINGVPATETTCDGHPCYEANVPGATSYEFVLTRKDEDPYKSTVSTPPGVNVTAPTAGASISRAEAFTITWDNNSSGTANLLIEGDTGDSCISDYPKFDSDRAIPDNGTYNVPAGGIEPFMSSDATKSCTAHLTISRTSGGTMAAGLEGTIEGRTSGGTSFTSTP